MAKYTQKMRADARGAGKITKDGNMSFKPALTDADIKRLSAKQDEVQRNRGVNLRVTWSLLNQHSEKLTEFAKNEPEAALDVLECIQGAAQSVESELKWFRAAEARLFAACHNAGYIDIPKKKSSRKEVDHG